MNFERRPPGLIVGPAEEAEDAIVDELGSALGLRVDAVASRRLAHARLLVARLGPAPGQGELVGFITYWVLGTEMEILTLGVMPPWRGRGIGRSLLEAALSSARNAGAEDAFLEVRPSNVAAIALYGAGGFRLWDRRSKYYADGEDALVFRSCLTRLPPADSALCFDPD